MKTFLISIFLFVCFLNFGQKPNYNIIENPKEIDYVGTYKNKNNTYTIYAEYLGCCTVLKCYKEGNEISNYHDKLKIAVYNDNSKNQFGLLDKSGKFYNKISRGTSGYYYPEASFIKLSEQDLESFSLRNLEIFRNELFAKHGYEFSNKRIEKIFSNKEWYKRFSLRGNQLTKNVTLSEIEKYNAELIKKVENKKRKVSKVLSKKEVNSIFTLEIKNELSIDLSIRKAFVCNDITGTYYLVLSEDNINEYNQNSNSYNTKIKAFFLKKEDNNFSIQWKIRDFVNSFENDIWFFTRYFDLKDIDKDGKIDPILIYGTSENGGNNDDRLKILIYYNNKKIAIRHQNCDLDDCRGTDIDQEFYDLPVSIQKHINDMMKEIELNNHSNFDKLPLGRH